MSKPTIGVDISKDHFDAHRLPDGISRQFKNTKAGCRAFLNWIGDGVERIVYEPTGPYHRTFEEACAASGAFLCKVNPKQARRFAEAIGTLAKTDRVDALMLANMGAMTEPKSRPIPDQNLRELKELRLAHEALVKERIRLKNRSQMLSMALIKRQHKRRMAQIERDLAAIKREIVKRIKADPGMSRRFEILTSIPGVGETTAFALIIDMPELGQLGSKQTASLAGLAPLARQSGRWTGRAFCRGGRASLRQALYMPALVAIRFNDDMKRIYQHLTEAGKPAKVAITAIMRKIIILANALIRDNRKWKKNTT